MEIIFTKRTSVEEVEEGKNLQPKFDENGLIPVITIDNDDNQVSIFYKNNTSETLDKMSKSLIAKELVNRVIDKLN